MSGAAPPSAAPPAELHVLPSPDAASPFDALPPELLISIFSFTPMRARFLALCRVSKRWHMYALRSVRQLNFRSADPRLTTEALLTPTLRRLPSLTSVKLALSSLSDVPLPATLARLSVQTGALRGDSVLMATFPNLTRLRFGLHRKANSANDLSAKFAAFIGRHKTSLTSLKIDTLPQIDTDAFLTCLAAHGLPALRTLSWKIPGEPASLAALLRSAPQLSSLRLSVDASATLLALPQTLLAPLECLVVRCDREITREEFVSEHISKFPRLRFRLVAGISRGEHP